LNFFDGVDSLQQYLVLERGLEYVINAVVQHEASAQLIGAVAVIVSILSYNEAYTIPMVELNILRALSVMSRSPDTEVLLYVARTITNLSADGMIFNFYISN
jgi:hypothetical protein